MEADRNWKDKYETTKTPEKWNYLKLYSYLSAIQPWSLSTSLMPTLLGYTLTHKSTLQNEHSLLISFLTLLTVVSVHCVGNLVNTYFDLVKRVDNRKNRRAFTNHKLSKNELVNFSGVVYTFGVICCVYLAALSPAKLKHLALIYFGGLSSSFLYTGRIRLKCIALGGVHIPMIFVPVSVLFAYLCQTGKLEWGTIYYAIPLALNAEATTRISNNNSLEADKKSNVATVAHTLSHILNAFLLFTPYITFVVLARRRFYWFLLPLITAPLAFQTEKRFRHPENLKSAPSSTAKLNFYFGLLYVLAVSLTDFGSAKTGRNNVGAILEPIFVRK